VTKSPYLLPFLALVAAGLSVASCTEAESPAQAQGAPQGPPPVTVAQPLVRDIIDWDEYSGYFAAVDRVEVRPRASGYLQSVHFRDGDFVRQGQLLFQIDPRPAAAELGQAQAAAAKARSDLQLARAELGRVEKLLGRGFVTKREYDVRKAALESAVAALDSSQAAIRGRSLDVVFAQLRAPISGRVSDIRVDRGNLVQGGQAGEATLLTTIVSTDPIQFEFDGSEAVYLKYQRQNRAGTRSSSRYAANPVEIRLSDDPGYTIRGRMDFVDNQLERGSGTIRGRALVPNPDGFLTPGMFGRLRLLGSGAYKALLVPDSAVVTDQTRKTVMTVARDGTVQPRIVELGPLSDGLRIVRTGLQPTDRVIIAGLQRVRPGDKALARPGRIVPPAPGTSPQVGASYSAPPASASSRAGQGR
jgi:RND family efflux transporter MFP subunit